MYIFAGVAQLIERFLAKEEVQGLSPCTRTILIHTFFKQHTFKRLSLSRALFDIIYCMSDQSASEQIDGIIKQYSGWKSDTLKRLRAIINDAGPGIVEEVKWKMPSNPRGLPVWSHNGIICIVQTFKNDIKLVFFQGPSLNDPKNLFNARLKSQTRAIEFHEGGPIDAAGIKALVVEAVKYNAKKANR